MLLLVRFTLWAAAAATALLVDVVTKAAPHQLVVNHYSHTSWLVLSVVGVSLYALGLWHSNTLAVGAGLMFGGLCGNGGQLLLYGYASDWIPVGGWLTNAADIAGALGLVCCFAGCLLSPRRRGPEPAECHKSQPN
jgi:hypothetical protein